MTVLRFNDFEMDIPARSLKRSGCEVRIGSRAFDLLAALAFRHGEIVSKAELMEVAWPDTHVEESSLRVNIVSLRKALDGGNPYSFVENVAGRGYTFTAIVTKHDEHRTTDATLRTDSLPNSCARLVGREQLISKWADMIGTGITTIVGQGGIGKTAVALRIASLLRDAYDSVVFLDIAGETASTRTPISMSLAVENLTSDVLRQAVESLAGQSALLVLDGCDWSIDRAALVAESLADRHPGLAILATSREPLGIIGENVLHLPGLEVPEAEQQIDDLVKFSAVELFAERVSMVAEEYAIGGAREIELAAEVVRKTDGNPLAIELAASRVADLGLENLVISLDRPLRTLRRGNRTAHPRQQTLRANIDWSYNLLDRNMQSLLGLLSMFDTEFTKEAANRRYGLEFARYDFEEAFDGLVMKSLIAGRPGGGTYALPGLIRQYALEKQAEATTATHLPSMNTELVPSYGDHHQGFPAPLSSRTNSRTATTTSNAA
ncbi:winged helix-turn-helix domain-containing protein [Neorhizobium sp. BT27B]|uniref:winged helix-turn-helix domain-containing protein n=1 Tax=Neorhizobium sp. BT27B TaxID=3142625 RepID=UPI003D2D4FEA